MKTEIKTFADSYEGKLRPFASSLESSVEVLANSPEATPLGGLRDALEKVQGDLKILQVRLRSEHAYVLIFGPLKSGKSTLMNAISGAYVSEVSSLPAYPCLVYVRSREEPHYTVFRYNGRKLEFSDGAALRAVIRDGHATLADHVRGAYDKGEEFDPGVHHPEAIERIEVGYPSGHLDSAGTVLVDTPGLYSGMNYGYDQLTRQFRNRAACAVYVVKAEGLFHERAFSEFDDLLAIFSRIFLVVNVDLSKRDLAEDGSLKQSLESEAPEQLIAAFESLAMSPQVRDAQASERLKIYPVDLLGAASASLRDGSSAPAAAGFGSFLDDLTAYLDQNEHLVEMMHDSLRQGTALATGVREASGEGALAAFNHSREVLEHERDEIAADLELLDNLSRIDWAKAFAEALGKCEGALKNMGKARATELAERFQAAVDQWFDSGDSLLAFQDNFINAPLGEGSEKLRGEVWQKMASWMRATGAVRLPVDEQHGFNKFKISPEGTYQRCAGQMGELAGGLEEEPSAVSIKGDSLQVRKRFFEAIFFTNMTVVRKRVFGDLDRPSNPIPSKQKHKRLGNPVRARLKERIAGHLEKHFLPAQGRFVERLRAAYLEAFKRDLQGQVDAAAADLGERQAAVQARIEENYRVHNQLNNLDSVTLALEEAVAELMERYGR